MSKIKFVLFLSLLVLFSGCQKDEAFDLEILSESAYNLDREPQSFKISVQSNADWQITGENSWCKPEKTFGSGSDVVTVNVEANVTPNIRIATLTIKNADTYKCVQISQAPLSKDYHYKLPVVFHVLYNDVSDREQNIDAQWIYKIIDECNAMYADVTKSTDMNLEFVAATHDPNGNPLAEVGINRIHWQSSIEMSCSDFMVDESMEKYVWDLENYINIFIYSFTEPNVLGISYLPYTVSSNALEGLNVGDVFFSDKEMYYPHCISINNQFVYTKHSVLSKYDITLTLTHELGHYLGLFHVFCNDGNKNATDYCADTETYNRTAYEDWLVGLTEAPALEELMQRTTSNGTIFTSYNIMDYDFSYLNRFTRNQFDRVRHVLTYSPLVPGPKIKNNRPVSRMNMERPKPILIK